MSDQNICRRDIIFLGSGKWKDIYDAATRMLKKLYIIRPELMWKYMTYVCPACGYVINNVLHEHVIHRWMPITPPCPWHRRIHTMWYNPELLMEDSRRFEKLRDLLVKKLILLEVLAKRYARKPSEA